MRRIADFLGISVSPEVWPSLVEAAGFDAMRRDGEVLMGGAAAGFQDGSRTFFHKGTNERWRGHFREEDLALYDAKVLACFSPACAQWAAHGRSNSDILSRRRRNLRRQRSPMVVVSQFARMTSVVTASTCTP